MNTYDVFVSLMDQIYYPGYAEELARVDPLKFTFEWKEFVSTYAP